MLKEKVFSSFTSLTYFVLVPYELEIHWGEEHLPKWNREHDLFIFLFFQMLLHVKTSKTLHTGLFSIFFFEISITLYGCSIYVCISVCTRYTLLWSSIMNYLPTKRTVEKIFLRVSGLECSPTKLLTGTTSMLAWIYSQMQSNWLWSLSYKIKLPFPLSLCPVFKLCSPSSLLRRGQKPKEKSNAAAGGTTYLLSTCSKIPLGWSQHWFP